MFHNRNIEMNRKKIMKIIGINVSNNKLNV